MAHQIKHLFQYQQEKMQHPDTWDDSGSFPKKQPLLSTPPSAPPRPHKAPMDPAELSYYEHKSKLRKTQVAHRAGGEEWEGGESPEESEDALPGEKPGAGGRSGHPHKYNRPPRDRQGELGRGGETRIKHIRARVPGC